MDHTGTAIDQQQNQDYQQFTQSGFSSQHPDHYPTQPARSNSDSPQRTSITASRGDSTQLISPTSDILNEMASAINEGYPQPVPLPIKDMGMDTPNFYGYNTTSFDQSGYGKPSTSSSFTSSSGAGFQNEFGLNGINYPVDGSGYMNGSQYSANTDFNFQKRKSIGSCAQWNISDHKSWVKGTTTTIVQQFGKPLRECLRITISSMPIPTQSTRIISTIPITNHYPRRHLRKPCFRVRIRVFKMYVYPSLITITD